MRPWCQVGSTRRCQRRGPGSSPGGRSMGLLVARMVACIHPSGVRFPGAPLCCPQIENRSRGSRSRGSLKASPVGAATAARCEARTHVATRSRARLVVRLGCLPGEAGSTPVESARLVVAQRTGAPPCDGGGRRFESSRRGCGLFASAIPPSGIAPLGSPPGGGGRSLKAPRFAGRNSPGAPLQAAASGTRVTQAFRPLPAKRESTKWIPAARSPACGGGRSLKASRFAGRNRSSAPLKAEVSDRASVRP